MHLIPHKTSTKSPTLASKCARRTAAWSLIRLCARFARAEGNGLSGVVSKGQNDPH